MYTIVITGASSGIGAALYNYYSSIPDCKVIGISPRGPDIYAELPGDINKIFDNWHFDYVDLLINCAGIMPFEESQKVMDVNFWGTYHMCTRIGDESKAAQIGEQCIINIASISGMVADPDLPIYAASKAAVLSLTKSLAKKYAPFTRVNCISPGFYKTNLVPGDTPDDLIQTIPMGYEETPSQLIAVVDAIWKTKYMTGTNVVIDGGVSL